MNPTEPGIRFELTYEQYAAIPAVSRSLLVAMATSPADGQQFMLSGGESTKALDFGIGSHALTLEPERFHSEFAIGPDVKLNTTAGKLEWMEFCRCHPGKQHIRGADGADMLGMRKRLFEHPVAKRLLTGDGENELVMVWRDKGSGSLCKIRPDRMTLWNGETAVVDYKTTTDASRTGFPKSYGQYLYYLQQAFYVDGITAVCGDPPMHFFFIAQEKKAPYKCNVFEFPSHRVEQGRRLYRELLEVHAACVKADSWPAIDGREYLAGVIESDVPNFAMRDAD